MRTLSAISFYLFCIVVWKGKFKFKMRLFQCKIHYVKEIVIKKVTLLVVLLFTVLFWIWI